MALLVAGVVWAVWPGGAALAQSEESDERRVAGPQESVVPSVEDIEPPPEALWVEEPAEPPPPPLPAEPPPLPGATAGRGPLIERVEVRSDAPLARADEIRKLIALTPGAPMTERSIRQTLRNLQATGTATEVEVYSRALDPDGTWVVAVVVLRSAYLIDDVGFDGELGIGRRDLERRLGTRRGQPLIESRLLADVFRLQDLYERRGYFDAVVRLDVATDPVTKRADIVFRIDAGPRSEIGDIRLVGDLGPFTSSQLAERLRLSTGAPFERERTRTAAERLQEWLIGEGYRTAEVEQPREESEPESRRIRLVYPVEVGPKVEVEVRGAKLKELRRRGLLPFLDDEGYDEALVLQSTDRLRTYFQEKGHWQVEVDWREEREEGLLRLVLEIVPGPEYTLSEVRFVGNQEIDDDRLADLMETSPRRLLALGSGRLVTEVLDADLDNIRSFYALQGYAGYSVGPPELEVGEESRAIVLTVPIEEGRRRQVVEMTFEGTRGLEVDGLTRGAALVEGGPYHPVLLEDTLDLVRARYAAAGYLAAQVSAELDWNPEETLVDVAVRVIEGPLTVVDRVIVRGNTRTELAVVEDAVDLAPGDPVSPTRLLEAERRLYRLGIFSQVDVELAPAELSEPSRDVIVRVEEGRTRRITYGLGYDTDTGARGILGYTQSNLFGRALTFQSDLRLGTEQQLVRLVLDQPAIGRYEIPILYLASFESEDKDTYTVDRLVTQVEAVRQDDEMRYGLLFDYRIVDQTLFDTVLPDDIVIDPRELRRDQDIEISSLVPNLLYDRRDNPVDPTRGWSALARLQYAFPLSGLTQADFLKSFLQYTHYQDVGFGYLAGSVRLGAIEPLSDSTPDPSIECLEIVDEPANCRVPIDERFFAGGDFSHRAFDRDKLGVPGQTVLDGRERGGAGLALFNLDYRFPVFGSLGGAVFVDVGNVWEDWQALDFGDLATGAGIELRYLSPLGPIRAGAAYQIDPLPGSTGDRYRFFLAIGNPF